MDPFARPVCYSMMNISFEESTFYDAFLVLNEGQSEKRKTCVWEGIQWNVSWQDIVRK